MSHHDHPPTERMGGDGAVLDDELDRARAVGKWAHRVVLVEGVSDQRAVEALARRQGRDLEGEGVAVIPIAGATNLGRFLEILGPDGHGVALAGLCDVGEKAAFRRAMEDGRLDLLGIFVCVRDLEDELIRALGADTMVEVIADQGRLRAFRSFQNQPAQRDKTLERQLWKWMGNYKIRFAPVLVEALDPDRVPRPLRGVLDAV